MVVQFYHFYMSIAFFDFDGTITKKDSLMHFTAFAKGRFIFYTGMLLLSPVFFCFKLGFVNAEKMKILMYLIKQPTYMQVVF